ncbi:MAG: DUF2842 domain-containing protein [Pseudomonadota bacterium]
MNPRARKFIGMIAILAFLAFYVVVIVTVGEHIPKHWVAQLAYFGLAGCLWGVPLFPLIRWMNR